MLNNYQPEMLTTGFNIFHFAEDGIGSTWYFFPSILSVDFNKENIYYYIFIPLHHVLNGSVCH
jgi:hypothetical protein